MLPAGMLSPGVETLPFEQVFVDGDQTQTSGSAATGIAHIDAEEVFSVNGGDKVGHWGGVKLYHLT